MSHTRLAKDPEEASEPAPFLDGVAGEVPMAVISLGPGRLFPVVSPTFRVQHSVGDHVAEGVEDLQAVGPGAYREPIRFGATLAHRDRVWAGSPAEFVAEYSQRQNVSLAWARRMRISLWGLRRAGGRETFMASNELATYRFTATESEAGEHAIVLEPLSGALPVLSPLEGLLTLKLKPGLTIYEARALARLLNEKVEGLGAKSLERTPEGGTALARPQASQ